MDDYESNEFSIVRLSTKLHESKELEKQVQDPAICTVVYSVLENNATPYFGVSPGMGAVSVTLRANRTEKVELLNQEVQVLVKGASKSVAKGFGFEFDLKFSNTDNFPGTVNDRSLVNTLKQAAANVNLQEQIEILDKPFAWSEDFAHFCKVLFGLRSGRTLPQRRASDVAKTEGTDEIVFLTSGRN